MSKTAAGWLLTAIWLVAILVYAVLDRSDFADLKPNTAGDFAAGVFAPLAFLWLVVGYLQQGEQLELQRQELALQRDELKAQREETARLADQATKQAQSVAANEMHARKDTFFRLYEILSAEQQSVSTCLHYNVFGTYTHAHPNYPIDDKNACYISLILGIFANENKFNNFRDDLLRNASINKMTDIYLANFRTLLRESALCDDKNVIRGELENSPMGTLYAGLCLVTGQAIGFLARQEPSGRQQVFFL